MAASCSNLKRSRTELLASTSKPDLQRQLGLVVKTANLLGGAVVIDDRKIALGQILYVAAMLVGDGEHDVHFIHRLGDRGARIVVCWSR